MVFPGRDGEVVRAVREGDMVVLPMGTVHWWHNSGDKSATAMATAINDLSILILADTSQALKYGEITVTIYLSIYPSMLIIHTFVLVLHVSILLIAHMA